MNITQDRLHSLHGADVYDRSGDKIGSIGQLYTDYAGQPTWASVKTGLFGMNESLVPLHDAELEGEQVRVPYEKSTVKDAPNVDASADEPLDGDDITRLYQHYNLSWDNSQASSYQAGARDTDQSYGTAATFDSGETNASDRTDNAMTRSEEQLRVGKQREEVGRARLRKYVVTENVQTTVPVQHEEVRVEREPITEANRGDAFSGAEITESEHEVTLHAERPVVQTETVPVERVRMGTETVTEQRTVGGEVRKEQIEADLPDDQGRRQL